MVGSIRLPKGEIEKQQAACLGARLFRGQAAGARRAGSYAHLTIVTHSKSSLLVFVEGSL